jgi:hypothetical protein
MQKKRENEREEEGRARGREGGMSPSNPVSVPAYD